MTTLEQTGDGQESAAAEQLEMGQGEESKESQSLIARWGFAVLVAIGVLAAGYAAWKVSVPQAIPDFALKSEALYRMEVGAGTFLGLYLIAMAFVLALNNRGFTDIGFNGLKAQDMANKSQQSAMQGQEDSIETLKGTVDAIGDSTAQTLEELRDRLTALEDQSSQKGETS